MILTEVLTKELDNYVSSYKNEIKEAKEEWTEIVNDLYSKEIKEGLSQTRAIGIINEFIEDDSIIVGASGSLPGDLQRMWRPTKPETYHME